ncbi:hypothetical protein [Oceanobacillus jeddahense]|uniref:hypothetical protein n=1 Tax=Oceanobacillus jeddahense TaxID=1462527 RepID=UPI00363ED591
MQCIVTQQYLLLENLLKKAYSPILAKNTQKCGFLSHMKRIHKTHQQILQSVYVFSYLLTTFLKIFLSQMQQRALLCRDLVQREIKELIYFPFHYTKGGDKNETIFLSNNHRKSI